MLSFEAKTNCLLISIEAKSTIEQKRMEDVGGKVDARIIFAWMEGWMDEQGFGEKLKREIAFTSRIGRNARGYFSALGTP